MRGRRNSAGAASRAAVIAALLLSSGLAVSQPQKAAPKIDADADRILRSMTRYLGGLQAFTAAYDVDDEVVDTDGQKLQFSSSGTFEVQRPGRFHATRTGGFAAAEVFLDGRSVTVLGKNQNAYMQRGGVSTIDGAIDALRQEGLDLAGADLLYTDSIEGLLTDVTRGIYVGPAVVDGIACDHLAFRAEKVDWQIWVQRGDKPLPLKYAITTKWITGAPQYEIRLHDWNVAPQVDARRFEFTPPAGAKKVESIPTNELGEPTEEAQR